MMVHLVHLVGGGHRQGVQERHFCSHVLAGPSKGQVRWRLMVDGGGDDPGSCSGLGEVDGCGPLHLERGLAAV
jgi:hypothetical protein